MACANMVKDMKSPCPISSPRWERKLYSEQFTRPSQPVLYGGENPMELHATSFATPPQHGIRDRRLAPAFPTSILLPRQATSFCFTSPALCPFSA